MRILLIAYEFPPSASPQSLRWAYLARELSLRGHDVHVLTIDLGPAAPGLPELPETVVLHRTHPGLIRGLMAKRRIRAARVAHSTQKPGAGGGLPAGALKPNWKHVIWNMLQRTAEYMVFPDLRGEWKRHGKRALRRLLQSTSPDVVISSHEPATTLELGLYARKCGYTWVADLGDPVLAPYTPARWRRRAHQLEAAVCMEAAAVLVTSEATASLLRQRHGGEPRIAVITQGFAAAQEAVPPQSAFGSNRLELFYSGSFYAFRRPEALVHAILGSPSARLTVASINPPPSIREAARAHPEKLRLLGFIPHAQALQLQREADVLVSIANSDPQQVPGKFYEYLGAGKPILHLHSGIPSDAASLLLEDLRRGIVLPNTAETIIGTLASLARSKEDDTLRTRFNLERAPVQAFAWPAIAERLEKLLMDLTVHAQPSSGVQGQISPAPPRPPARGG